MSSLTTTEKRYIEALFGMETGYVIDFSDRTFFEFFRDELQIDIDAIKYQKNGTSKAKRLRAFWEIELDPLVGKAIESLLEVWLFNNHDSSDDAKYKKCREVAARLVGQEPFRNNAVKDFLQSNISLPNLKALSLEESITKILHDRLKEIESCLKNGSSLSVIFMCGSVLEGIFLGVAQRNPSKFNSAKGSPKYKDNKVKQFQDWTLSSFIDVAFEINLIQLDVKTYSHSLRDFRNYIHPYQQMVSKFTPDRHTAEISFQVLKAAIADLSGKR